MKTPSGSKNFEFSLTADSPELAALSSASHGDPFAILGRHAIGESEVVRCFLPRTRQAWLEDESRPLQRLPGTDLFEFRARAGDEVVAGVAVQRVVVRAGRAMRWPGAGVQSGKPRSFHHIMRITIQAKCLQN